VTHQRIAVALNVSEDDLPIRVRHFLWISVLGKSVLPRLGLGQGRAVLIGRPGRFVRSVLLGEMIIPLSNVGPALVIALISLAYLEEDGILLSIAMLAAVIMLTIVLAALWGMVLGADRFIGLG
jgi:hypothetical protein